MKEGAAAALITDFLANVTMNPDVEPAEFIQCMAAGLGSYMGLHVKKEFNEDVFALVNTQMRQTMDALSQHKAGPGLNIVHVHVVGNPASGNRKGPH